VLADIGMPGRDGYAVAAHVQATPALARIPVLLLAGAFEPVDEARVAATGCAGVLVKPFEPQMVIARVRKLLEQRRTAPHAAPTPGTPAKAAPPADDDSGQVPDAASALMAAPPAAPDRAASVEDYFERLDAAFASLNAQAEPTQGPAAPAPTPEPQPSPAPPEWMPSQGVLASGGSPDVTPASHAVATDRRESGTALGGEPLSMADAFDALLGVEQGGPLPLLPENWAPIVSDDLVDRVARRVADQVSERVVRDLAPEIVTRVAERLVREEIARLEAEAETP
jgi:hypothetical protein